MRTSSIQPPRISVASLGEKGMVHCEFIPSQFTLADLPKLYALPAFVRKGVMNAMQEGSPRCEVLHNGNDHPPYMVTVDVVSPGSIDANEFAKYRIDLAETFIVRRPGEQQGWGTSHA